MNNGLSGRDVRAARLKATGTEVIVSTLNDFQIIALLDALKKVNHAHVYILGGDTIKTTLMLKNGAGIVRGLYATSPILDAREFSAGAAFLEKYQAKFKMAPAYGGHYTYDAMHVLAAAIRRSESAKPENIVETLRKIDGYAPVTGSMKWNDKGEQRYGVISVYSKNGAVWESQVRSDSW